MDNLEWLKNVKNIDEQIREDPLYEKGNDIKNEYRKVKALEIIAEQTIRLDNGLDAIITTLEKIETALNRR